MPLYAKGGRESETKASKIVPSGSRRRRERTPPLCGSSATVPSSHPRRDPSWCLLHKHKRDGYGKAQFQVAKLRQKRFLHWREPWLQCIGKAMYWTKVLHTRQDLVLCFTLIAPLV
ncbi:hypothetical protein CCR75_003497 [Bremia lactucae]|uniref:Uncharacterized protein n=1 Tax=Bremia lactucae TaxID=4779 RepID=A0A976FR45_BRELC|nr:hypothetical protein CCR75_003497 [Bremia lactucae]